MQEYHNELGNEPNYNRIQYQASQHLRAEHFDTINVAQWFLCYVIYACGSMYKVDTKIEWNAM